MSTFIFFFVLNMAIIIYIIKWRGIFSAEGFGMAFLALSVATDGLGLLAMFNDRTFSQELQFRFLPNIVLTIGLVSLIAGLFMAWAKPKSVCYDISTINEGSRKKIEVLSYGFVCIGLCMHIYALRMSGVTNLQSYFYYDLYMYQALKQGGGFLDSGLTFALWGFSLLFILYERNKFRQHVIIMLMILLSFFLSPSKSGINTALFALFFTIGIFKNGMLKKFMRPIPLLFMIIVLFLGLGIKAQIKYHSYVSTAHIADSALDTLSGRYSSHGLYKGYCALVNRMVEHNYLFFGSTIMTNTLTAWIPRFVWKDKPDHPFLARGDLISEEGTVDIYGNEAPTFAGFAFCDSGFFSLIVYLFFGGLILSIIRRYISINNSFLLTLGYAFFANGMGGSLAESGFLNLFYLLGFSLLFVSVAAILMVGATISVKIK